MLSQLLESAMMLAFGFAWPTSIINSLRLKTAKGKSPAFLCIVLFGYICGLGAKAVSGHLNYVAVFYLVNFFMVLFDLLLYFRNKKLDRQREAARLSESRP